MKTPVIPYEPSKRARTDYRIGLSAWTDRPMLEEGHFYPYKTMSAEERLWWYSQYFDVVEVNSSFYAIPSPDITKLWVARTQPDFLFNVKAFGLLIGHHVDAARISDGLRKTLPARLRTRRRDESRTVTSRPMHGSGPPRASNRTRSSSQGREAGLRALPARPMDQVLR